MRAREPAFEPRDLTDGDGPGDHTFIVFPRKEKSPFMMRIPTCVAPSSIAGAGNGLFTECFVPAGHVIWQFDPGLDLLLDALPEDPVLRSFVERYGYEPLGEPGRWLVCVDNGRFINHSDKPNTRDTRDHTFAAVDLRPGTEITSDYRAFCERPFLGWLEGAPAHMMDGALSVEGKLGTFA